MPRTARTEEIHAERRRRKDTTLNRMGEDKLGVPASWLEAGGVLDRSKWQGRWINDAANRMYNLTKADDYDPVSFDGGEAPEQQVRRPVGTDEAGQPIYAYLCRKPLPFFEEDQQRKVEQTQVAEKGVLESVQAEPGKSPEGNTYALPGNTINRGSYSP